ncbi:unnamed protein product [Oikopleura dioica]|uniref:RING-type domain-containing protein n=1 Tax=Oikopleura dioica TaxID=34765 RepID=E4YA68_OIKDI|nr:unnamed protein product [Oikopleura dioica]
MAPTTFGAKSPVHGWLARPSLSPHLSVDTPSADSFADEPTLALRRRGKFNDLDGNNNNNDEKSLSTRVKTLKRSKSQQPIQKKVAHSATLSSLPPPPLMKKQKSDDCTPHLSAEEEEDDSCVICDKTFKQDCYKIVTYPCAHIFCSHCLATSENSSTLAFSAYDNEGANRCILCTQEILTFFKLADSELTIVSPPTEPVPSRVQQCKKRRRPALSSTTVPIDLSISKL